MGVSRRRRLVVGGRSAGLRAHRARASPTGPARVSLLTSFEPDAIHASIAEAAQECGIPFERGLQRSVAGRGVVHAVQHRGRRPAQHRSGLHPPGRGRREPRGGHRRDRATPAVRRHTVRRRGMVAGRPDRVARRPSRSSCAAERSGRRSSCCSPASGPQITCARSESTSSQTCPGSARTCTTICSRR